MHTRSSLLDAVDQLRPIVDADWMTMEQDATLPFGACDCARRFGCADDVAPLAVGGSELDIVPQLDVYQAVGYLDAPLCWTMMTCGTGISWPAGYLSEPARKVIYGGDHDAPLGTPPREYASPRSGSQQRASDNR